MSWRRADDGEHEPARGIAREGEPDAAAGEGRDQHEVERLMRGDGEGVRPGERQADDHGAERDRGHQPGWAGAEQERPRQQREAAQELEGAVEWGGRCFGSCHQGGRPAARCL